MTNHATDPGGVQVRLAGSLSQRKAYSPSTIAIRAKLPHCRTLGIDLMANMASSLSSIVVPGSDLLDVLHDILIARSNSDARDLSRIGESCWVLTMRVSPLT